MQFTISLLSVILSAFNMHNKVMNAMIVKPVRYRHTRAMKPYKQLLLLRGSLYNIVTDVDRK